MYAAIPAIIEVTFSHMWITERGTVSATRKRACTRYFFIGNNGEFKAE